MLAKGSANEHYARMLDLDLNGSLPRPKWLLEAQQTIDTLWVMLQESRKRTQEWEEQRNTESKNSWKPPSSDSH